MKLRNLSGDETRATMWLDGDPAKIVTVRAHDAIGVARKIALCVNMHDGMVRVLDMFSSRQMGNMLVDVIVNSFEDEAKGAVVEDRLRRLVNAVDLIMKEAEPADTLEDIKS